MEQTASSHMPYGAHSLPSPSPWSVYTETPGQHHSPAPGAYQSPGLHGLQGLDMAQISQVRGSFMWPVAQSIQCNSNQAFHCLPAPGA